VDSVEVAVATEVAVEAVEEEAAVVVSVEVTLRVPPLTCRKSLTSLTFVKTR